jgi:hypothetical protein
VYYHYQHQTMPFGKWKNQPLSDIPSGYFEWCLENVRLEDYGRWLRRAILAELDRREVEANEARCTGARTSTAGESNLPALLSPLIAQWYRALARRWHPDAGGDTLAMQVVNDAHDRLRQLVGV